MAKTFAPPPTATAEDKLAWEVEKLKFEADALRRPFLKTPASWITIVTVILAVSGIVTQYFNSSRDYQLAEIKRQQATLEIEQAKRFKLQLEEEISKASDSLTQLQAQRQEVSENLMQLLGKSKELENKVSNSGDSGIKLTAQQVTQSIDNLSKLNEEAANQAERTTNTLQDMRTSLGDGVLSLPAFAVIASFLTVEDANKYAVRVKEKGISYPVEVYQRSPNRILVTLGGYLSETDATTRVEYAKEQNIAKDAYVRFAKDWGQNLFK